MAQNVLTDTKVRNAKPAEREFFLSDGDGLFLRIRPNGDKLWIFRYSFGDARKKISLGSYPAVSLSRARTEAASLRDALAQHIDPQTERSARIAAELARATALAAQNDRPSVRDLFEQWARTDLVRRKDGGAEVRRSMEKDALPKIGQILLDDIKKGDITRVTDAILERGVSRTAKVVLSYMRQMFRFAVVRDMIDSDPTSAISKKSIGGADIECDRTLSPAEIQQLDTAMSQSKLKPAAQHALWIMLATGCRIGELSSSKWSHVDFSARTWWIPPEHSKNGRAHTIHLSEFARMHFQALMGPPQTNGDSAGSTKQSTWVLPGRGLSMPLSSKTITKQVADRQRIDMKRLQKRIGKKHAQSLVLSGGRWTPHDLRRTAATMMVAMGTLPEVAERCLNHTEENRLKRTYQRHSYEAEMREAWDRLGMQLQSLATTCTRHINT